MFRISLATPTNNHARTGRRTKLQPSEALVRKLGPPGRGGPGGPDGPGSQGGPQGQGQGRRAAPQLPLLYATWSPSGHSLAYVFSNNIFYRKSPDSEDVAITTSGAGGQSTAIKLGNGNHSNNSHQPTFCLKRVISL